MCVYVLLCELDLSAENKLTSNSLLKSTLFFITGTTKGRKKAERWQEEWGRKKVDMKRKRYDGE